jgi:rare lipoprotein A
MKRLLPVLLTVALAACSTAPKKGDAPGASGGHHKPATGNTVVRGGGTHTPKDCSFYAPAQEDLGKRGNYTAGGLYAPGVADTTPDHVPDLDCIAEPLVTSEARSPIGNRSPYSVLGKQYKVMDDVHGYVESGTASYYGNKFHGRLTSNREVYDMYAYSAAHKTLPLPSFALVTNLDNGESVIVRVNDRGPFHDGRVIDLSYAAAIRLGITQRGTGRVEVRALTPDDMRSGELAKRQAAARSGVPRVAAAVPAAATTVAAANSAMDRMVEQLPARDSTPVPAAVATRAAAPRFHVDAKAGDTPSADDFDAWLKANHVNVATGKPGAPAPSPNAAVAAAAVASAQNTVAAATTPARAPTVVNPRTGLSPLQLQVASFASRENADRALARLVAAGIDGASLSDVQSNGRVLWRLRVGATDAARADELAGRIANLGFARPQLVRE